MVTRPEDDTLIVKRFMDDRFLSNSYLVADRPGGHAVIVDTGGPADRLRGEIDALELKVAYILCTHHHSDHVSGNGLFRKLYGAPVCCHLSEAVFLPGVDNVLQDDQELEAGNLGIRVLHLPGHTAGQAGFLVNDRMVFTGDTLFRRSVGGTAGPGHTSFEDLCSSVMERLMVLPPETEVHPGHSGKTSVAEEWEENPFIRAWRGLDDQADLRCTASGHPATLLVRARDYDGGFKCWVRFHRDNRDAIVPGSSVVLPERHQESHF